MHIQKNFYFFSSFCKNNVKAFLLQNKLNKQLNPTFSGILNKI